jgi:hypothetical protein
MTRHMLSVATAVVAIFALLTAKPATAALPGYLGDFGTERDNLSDMVFLYTFDQHECSASPTFENKGNVNLVGSLTLNSAANIPATCRTGTDAGFENTPIDPGFNMTNSDANNGISADFLTTPEFTSGIVSGVSTLEMWIEFDILTFVHLSGTTIARLGKYTANRRWNM